MNAETKKVSGYAVGHYYFSLWGLLETQARVNAVKVTEAEARAWVERLAPGAQVFIGGTTCLGSQYQDTISFNKQSVKRGTLSLDTVLHEIAHVLCYRRRMGRYARRKQMTWRSADIARRNRKHHADGRHHDEVFWRVFANLLRAHVPPVEQPATQSFDGWVL